LQNGLKIISSYVVFELTAGVLTYTTRITMCIYGVQNAHVCPLPKGVKYELIPQFT